MKYFYVALFVFIALAYIAGADQESQRQTCESGAARRCHYSPGRDEWHYTPCNGNQQVGTCPPNIKCSEQGDEPCPRKLGKRQVNPLGSNPLGIVRDLLPTFANTLEVDVGSVGSVNSNINILAGQEGVAADASFSRR